MKTPFQMHLSYMCEFLRDLCQKPTPDTRDDFYSAMSIESLASVPSHTAQLHHFNNVRITYGPGATAVFTRLLIGKCDTVKSFSDSCKSISDYLDENYSDTIAPESSVSYEDIEEFISNIAKDGEVASILSDNNTKFKILLMPAEANADTPGLVYIHNQPTEQAFSYTMVLPQSKELTSKQSLLHMLLSELSVCFADYQIRKCIYEPSEMHQTTSAMDPSCPLVYCKQSRNNEKSINHLKAIHNAQPTILANLKEKLPPIVQDP